MNDVEQVTNKIKDLPTLPQVVQKVISMVADPDVSTAELAKTIGMDAALVSKILKIVNSVYYGLPRKISTLTQATVILGFNAIKNIVITSSVFTSFKGNGRNHRFDRSKFWEHSIGCAAACKVISKRIRLGLPEEAFVTGLIHDIGKIVLDQFLHEEFERVLDLVEMKNLSFFEVEREILGTDHTQIGKWLCDKWRFPDKVLEPVQFHHSPFSAENYTKMVVVVYLGNILAKKERLGFAGDEIVPEIDPKSWELLGIAEDEVGELIVEIKEEFSKASVFLELLK